MRKIWLIFGLLTVGACSDPEETARFLIEPPTPTGRVANRIGSAELRDVSLPEYAANQQVPYQTADGAVRSTPDNVWADSPERAFTVTLARAISEHSNAVVIPEPWPLAEAPKKRIEVRVETALAGADRIYRLRGRYFVSDDAPGGTNLSRGFDIQIPIPVEGPRGIAIAQSAAISQLAHQMAALQGPGGAIPTRSPDRGADMFALDPII